MMRKTSGTIAVPRQKERRSNLVLNYEDSRGGRVFRAIILNLIVVSFGSHFTQG